MIKNIESLIVSHTYRESVVFVDGHIKDDTELDKFIVDLFGDLATETGFVDAIKEVYPPVRNRERKYQNETAKYYVMNIIGGLYAIV